MTTTSDRGNVPHDPTAGGPGAVAAPDPESALGTRSGPGGAPGAPHPAVPALPLGKPATPAPSPSPGQRSVRWTLLAVAFFTGVLTAGIILAWPPFLALLTSAGVYASACTDHGRPVGCEAQILRLNAVFTVGSATILFASVVLGPLLDRLGPRAATLGTLCLACAGYLLFAIGAQTGADVFLPASVLMSMGIFVQPSMLSVANLFTQVSTAIALVTSTVAASAVTVYVWEGVLHRALGVSFAGIMYLQCGAVAVFGVLVALLIPDQVLESGVSARWGWSQRMCLVTYTSSQPGVAAGLPGRDAGPAPRIPVVTVIEATPASHDDEAGQAQDKVPQYPDAGISSVAFTDHLSQPAQAPPPNPDASAGDPSAQTSYACIQYVDSASGTSSGSGDTHPSSSAGRLSEHPTGYQAPQIVVSTATPPVPKPDIQPHIGSIVTASNARISRRYSIRNLPRFTGFRQFVRLRRFWVLLGYLALTNWRLDFYISALFPNLGLLIDQQGPGPGSSLLFDLSGLLLPLSAPLTLAMGLGVAFQNELNMIWLIAVFFLVFNVLAAIPVYIVQFIAFLMYLFTRPILFVTFWALMNRLCEPQVVGRAIGVMMFVAGALSLSNLLLSFLSLSVRTFLPVNIFFLFVNLLMFMVPLALRSDTSQTPIVAGSEPKQIGTGYGGVLSPRQRAPREP